MAPNADATPAVDDELDIEEDDGVDDEVPDPPIEPLALDPDDDDEDDPDDDETRVMSNDEVPLD